MDPKVKMILDTVIDNLLRANVEIPIILATAKGLVEVFKAAFGSGPSFTEVISAVESKVAANEAFYLRAKAELEGMKG